MIKFYLFIFLVYMVIAIEFIVSEVIVGNTIYAHFLLWNLRRDYFADRLVRSWRDHHAVAFDFFNRLSSFQNLSCD